MPGLEIGTFIKIPEFSRMFSEVSIFGVGIPPASMFIKALPLALVSYVIAFGDFVTTETLVTEARQSRDDEYIDFNSSRSNMVSGLRNVLLAIFAPFPPLSGPLCWYDRIGIYSLSGRKESDEIPSAWYVILSSGNISECYDHTGSELFPANLWCGIIDHVAVSGICLCENWYGLL